MKKPIVIRLLIILVIVINFLVLTSHIYLLNILSLLLLAIFSIPALIRLKFSIPLVILLFLFSFGHLFNILILHSKPYFDSSYPLSYLFLLLPVFEFGLAFVIIKLYLRNRN